jgi:adenylate cyclase
VSIAGQVALALVLLLWLAGILTWPELVSLDLRYRVRGAVDPGQKIVLAPISKRMLDLGIYPVPLPRAIYAHALANLRQAGARAVGIDVLMESETLDDAALAAELRRWQGRVVLAIRRAANAGQSMHGNTPIDTRDAIANSGRDARNTFLLPGGVGGTLAPFWPHGVGMTEITQDQDGVVHSYTLSTGVAGSVIASFPLALARLADPAAVARYRHATAITIDYAGPSPAFPVAADLDLVANGLFDPRAVAGKIVLIGATDPSLKDLFPGPFDAGAALTPGVEVNADVLWTILQNRALDSVPDPVDALALLGLGALVLVSNLRLRPLLATCATVLALVGYAALAQILFDHQIWLDLVGPLLASGLVYVAVQAARVAESIQELRRVEGIFGRYVSHAVVRQLLGKTDALRLGGQRREISVLFSDIRGFTSFSEQLPPEEVGVMLNEYFAVTVAVIFAHGGTVDKFVGDAIMALFNAPLDQPDHAERAVKTALAMQEATHALAVEWEKRGRPRLRIGIGIHTGLAVVGSFGAEQRSDYTVVGDTVNVAARLEGMSKDLDCLIVISAVTAQRLPTLAPFEPLGMVTIRGREAGLEVYGVRR